MEKVFTKDMVEFLLTTKGRTNKELLDLLNKTFNTNITMQQMLARKCYQKSLGKPVETMKSKLFTFEMLEYMKQVAPGKIAVEIRDLVNEKFGTNLTTTQIINRKKKDRIHSGPESLIGRHFGMETQFKKGQEATNKYPLYSQVLKEGYLKIKIAEPDVWRFKHHLVWEMYHGPIPKGKIITFLNGNRLDMRIENLEAVDMNEHARLNKGKWRCRNIDIPKAYLQSFRLKRRIAELKGDQNGN